MKDTTHCPLCGSELSPDNGNSKCNVCGAKEHRIPGFGILIGYLYDSEYQQYKKLGTILMILIVIALLVLYIFEWRINQIRPDKVSELWLPWLEKIYESL